jgi:tetratricopeptide (TPR) repeat protein
MSGGSKKKREQKKPGTTSASKGASGKKQLRAAQRAAFGHAADPRIDQAQEAWAQRRYDDSIRLYERALQRAPTNAVLLVDLARAYALRFRFGEAETLVDRASRLHPDDARLQRMLGRSYVQLQQFDRAIHCFQRSLELEPESAERARTLYELAQMYERLHRLAEARDCAEASLRLAPEQPVLRYLLAVVDRRAGNAEAALQAFQEVAAADGATTELAADCSYQVAAIHDSQGRYERAFDAATRAKRLLNNIARPMKYDAADIAEASRRTLRTLTPEHFRRWSEAAGSLKPLPSRLALLTSHPRSGTTLLEQVLDGHSQLISADELRVMSELVYLPLCQNAPTSTPVPEILDVASLEALNERRRAYWAAMEGALRQPVGQRTMLDKNPALTGLLPVIARVFPEMKVIFALRDPRDVVVSCFLQQLPLNPMSVHYLSLEQTAEEYAATMRLWLKVRDLIGNQWIEVRYEETVSNLEGQARRVLEFLELPWDEAVLEYRERAESKHVHSPTYAAVTKPLYTSSIGRWKNYAKWLEPCMATLKPYVAAFGYEA